MADEWCHHVRYSGVPRGQVSLTPEGLLDADSLREIKGKLGQHLLDAQRTMREKQTAADNAARAAAGHKRSSVVHAGATGGFGDSFAALTAAAASRKSESDEAVEALQEPMLVLSGGDKRLLPLPLRVHLLDGGAEALELVTSWEDVPSCQIAGQSVVWLAARKGLEKQAAAYSKALDEALAASKEVAKREGAAAPVIELCRLMDVLDARGATIEYLAAELSQRIPLTHKHRDVCAKLHAANEPPVPVPPSNPNDLPSWDTWMADVQAAFAAFKEVVHGVGGCERLGVAKADVQKVQLRSELLQREHDELHGHCVAWLRCEGQLRVLASLQDPERLRLKRVLLGKRSDAYRRMCAEPVDTKLQYKAATREVSSP